MSKAIIQSPNAPAAIGTYSQAVRVGHTVYLSGQIGLDPATMLMAEGIDAQIERVFANLRAVVEKLRFFDEICQGQCLSHRPREFRQSQ